MRKIMYRDRYVIYLYQLFIMNWSQNKINPTKKTPGVKI